MTFIVKGEKEMLRNLKSLPNKIARKVARVSLVASGKPIAQRAKDNLRPHRRTGRLIKSIKVKSAGKGRVGPADEVVVLIGPTELGFYGGFLEFGTSRIPGIHWLRDATDSRSDE